MRKAVDDLRRQELLAANLRYGGFAEPLRNRAYAQVVAKVLLSEPAEAFLSKGKIRTGAARLGGFSRPSEQAIDLALQHLTTLGQIEVHPKRGKYRLRASSRADLERQLGERRTRVEAAIRRHIPNDIPLAQARDWFEAAAVAFFSQYGAIWAASVARSDVEMPKRSDMRSAVVQTASSAGLGGRESELLEGFSRFVLSEEVEDEELRWHYGRSMFAAQLLAADLGADPISARELEGSTLMFDTNVLIDIALDHDDLREAFNGLGAALARRGIKAVLLPATVEEFTAVVGSWAETTLHAYDKHNYVVVRGADDDYMRLARDRNAVTREDFEALFRDLAQIPPGLGTLELRRLSDRDALQAADEATKDADLVKEIQEIWKERRPWHHGKKNHRAKHDAALTGAVRGLRAAGQTAYVVSQDLTMRSLAERWSKPRGEPLWISIDALLQVLAVDEEGGTDAINFSPILSRLIAADVESSKLDYTIVDIDWLDSLTQGVEDLLPEDVQELARQVHRRRLLGAERDDPELRARVERLTLRKRRDYDADIQAASAAARAAEMRAAERDRENLSLHDENDGLRSALLEERLREPVKRIRGRALTRLFVDGLVALGLGALLLFVAFILTALVWREENSTADRISFLTLMLSWVIGAPWWLLARRWPAYKSRVAGARAEALARIEDEEGEELGKRERVHA